ncbi:hypothetical protein HDZ31DRAFT_80777 [Schizophyllum fasciatum]
MSSSKVDIFSNFSCLDDVIQVIHQGTDKFVLTSTVTKDSWDIHISLEGRRGRWWEGQWQEADVTKIVGTKAAAKMFNTFSNKLRESIVKGDICIGNWDAKPDAEIDLTLGPSAKKPLHVPLTEMSATDAAAYATRLLLKVAQNAQSRECRLLATAADTAPAPRSPDRKRRAEAPEPEPSDPYYPPRPRGYRGPAEILRQQSLAQWDDSKMPQFQAPPPRPRARKGASLANPNKKARRYEALQFIDSDEEDK